MKPIALLVALTTLLVAAGCTTSDEPSTTPSSLPAGPAEATLDDATKAIGVSDQALEAAEKACRGCPDSKACEQALAVALQATTAALQSAASGSDHLDQRAQQTESLAKRFDALAELSNECL